jgi:hypothetical protein
MFLVHKVKLSLCLIKYAPRHEDVWRSGDIVLPFFSALDGGEWSASCPSHFTPGGSSPSIHWKVLLIPQFFLCIVIHITKNYEKEKQ